ncbi:MAG: hypothetical protein JSU04_14755 [Bdellovibrionales bacterium]|nr:hypothetical protein [Bdellovibrionales bacterium]
MKLTTAALTALCFLALTACKDFSGNLVVDQKLTLVDGRSTVDVQPGTYNGQIKIQSKKKIKLEVALPQGKSTFVFKTAENLKELHSGQRIQIASSVSGQPYNVDGKYDVDYSSSGDYNGTESCTYYTTEYRCHDVRIPEQCDTVTECDPHNPSQCATRSHCKGGGYRTECGDEQVSHYGSQNVTYSYDTTTESVTLQLLSAGGRVAATFRGSDSDSSKNYSYRSECR